MAFILVGSVFLAYQPVWRGLPIWDDLEQMAPPRSLWRIWFKPGAIQHYYPLLDTAFWIQGKLWHGSTLGYHLVNIACHAAGALLVLIILRRLRVRGAWLAAGIFALHPVHVESVAWISELKNTLSGVFYLSAVLAYLRFDESRERSWFAVAAVLFLCALLTKSTAVMWPLGMAVILRWKHAELSWRRDVLPLIPLQLLAILDGLVAVWIERYALGETAAELQLTFVQRLLVAGHACWFYWGKLVWPAALCPVYPRWRIERVTWIDFLYPVGVVLLLAGLWIWRNRSRAPFTGVLFFIGTIFPVIGVVSFSYFNYSFVADHFQYLASLGVIALLAAGAVRLQERWRLLVRPVGVSFCLVILALLAGLTWRHSRAYTDLETLARTTLARNPDCWIARSHLGIVFLGWGAWAEAADQFEDVLRRNPRYALGHYSLGCALAAQGRLEEAIQQYRLAVQLQPKLGQAYYNLGCALASQEKFTEAIDQYQQALRLKRDAPEIHNNLGIALASSGRFDEAIEQFREAVQLNPHFVEAKANLQRALNARNN